MLGWLKDTAESVKKAGTETLEMVGESVAGVLVTAVSIPSSKPQVESSDNGQGGTVVQPVPTGIAGTVRAGVPAWGQPMFYGVLGVTAGVVLLGLLVGGRRK